MEFLNNQLDSSTFFYRFLKNELKPIGMVAFTISAERVLNICQMHMYLGLFCPFGHSPFYHYSMSVFTPSNCPCSGIYFVSCKDSCSRFHWTHFGMGYLPRPYPCPAPFTFNHSLLFYLKWVSSTGRQPVARSFCCYSSPTVSVPVGVSWVILF